jgi:predicted nuclease of predicted toxin-antitoxin system
MRFLADECVYMVTIEYLRNLGHEILRVVDVGLGGARDSGIIAFAKEKGLTLITRDSNFTNILRYPPRDYFGIVVLKVRPETVFGVHMVLKELLGRFKDLRGRLVIVDKNKFRLRG